jgi:hypothetical protein
LVKNYDSLSIKYKMHQKYSTFSDVEKWKKGEEAIINTHTTDSDSDIELRKSAQKNLSDILTYKTYITRPNSRKSVKAPN